MALVRSLLFTNINRLIPPLKAILPHRLLNTNAATFPTCFRATLPVMAEPLKKKKKMDPALIKAREEKKKRRIEKTIRKLEKNSRQIKPVEEIGTPISLLKEEKLRARNEHLSAEEMANYEGLLKQWTAYKYRQHLTETQMIIRVMASQEKALDQLRSISEQLYIEAIQMDLNLLPFEVSGPTQTPPLANYEAPDGDYVDVSPKWN